MDPSLLKERNAFKRKALVTPVVESRPKRPIAPPEPSRKRPKPSPLSGGSDHLPAARPSSGNTQYRFGVLAKIVRHMRQRHQEGNLYPLTLDEILDETNQLDAGIKVKQWLANEALPGNPKIACVELSKYQFKPPYEVRDRKSLLKLLRKHDLKGYGGLLLENVQESLPNSERILKQLSNDIIFITRPIDKKKVIFYNDRTARFDVDEELARMWRTVAVRGVDDEKIEEYLEKQGLQAMHDHADRKPLPKRKTKARKKVSKAPKDNEHLKDVLESYEES